jgi:Helix-loop-helix DNA-binding domain
MPSPIPPPVPFADFEFTFDPALSNIFPPQPPLPSSADLFSPSETTHLLGFLDNFNWEFDNQDPLFSDTFTFSPYSNPHQIPSPSDPPITKQLPSRPTSSRGSTLTPVEDASQTVNINYSTGDSQSRTSESPVTPIRPSPSSKQQPPPENPAPPPRAKPLLSSPQKRLNHIMSEQKRRNAIRDGYAQLIGLLAPAGSAPGIGMPTRGRPKGSGSRGKGRSKGKSGVLFRAVEYCRWLEDGRDALRDEVLRLEAAISQN